LSKWRGAEKDTKKYAKGRVSFEKSIDKKTGKVYNYLHKTTGCTTPASL
jgi:hypothetical protein